MTRTPTVGRFLDTQNIRIEKLLLASCFFLTAIFNTYLILTPPAKSYEKTVYSAYPTEIWFVFLLSLFVSLYILQKNRGRIFRLALVNVLICYLLLFMVPVFRGYALYGRVSTDTLSHFGYAKSVLLTGSVLSFDWYPIVHILQAMLQMVGLRPTAITSLLGFFFFTLFITGTYILIFQLSSSRRLAASMVIPSTLLVFSKFHFQIYPNVMSLLLIPLVLFTFEWYKTRGTLRTGLCFLLLSCTVVLFHPLTSIILFIMLSISISLTATAGLLTKREGIIGQKLGWKLVSTPVLFYTFWYLHFNKMRWNIRLFVLKYFGENPSSTGEPTTRLIDVILDRWEMGVDVLLIRVFETYGHIIIISVMSVLSLYIIVRKIYAEDHEYAELYLIAQFSMSLIVTAFLFLGFHLSAHPLRMSQYYLIMCVFLTGYFLHIARTSELYPVKLRKLLIFLLLLSSLTLALNSYIPSNHMTHSELEGNNWFIDNNADHEIISMEYSRENKMLYYIKGAHDERARSYKYQSPRQDWRPPAKLGYPSASSVKSINEDKSYLIIQKPEVMYDGSYRNNIVGRKDINKARSDSGANKIYTNGEFWIWLTS